MTGLVEHIDYEITFQLVGQKCSDVQADMYACTINTSASLANGDTGAVLLTTPSGAHHMEVTADCPPDIKNAGAAINFGFDLVPPKSEAYCDILAVTLSVDSTNCSEVG